MSMPHEFHISSPAGGWSGTVALVPAVTGQAVNLYGLVLAPYGTQPATFQFVNDDGTPVSAEYFVSGGSLVMPAQVNGAIWLHSEVSSGLSLKITAGALSGELWGRQEGAG